MKVLILIFTLFLIGCGSDDVYIGADKKVRIIGNDSVHISYHADVVTGYKTKRAHGSDTFYQQPIFGKTKKYSGGWYRIEEALGNQTVGEVFVKDQDKVMIFEIYENDCPNFELIFTSNGIFDNRGNKWEKQ